MRDDFVRLFGEDEAQRVEAAAVEHENGVHDDRGSDPFRWALLICLGFQCLEIGSYRDHHGIVASWGDLRAWMLAQPEWFSEHDGDCDYIALMAGTYNEYVGRDPA